MGIDIKLTLVGTSVSQKGGSGVICDFAICIGDIQGGERGDVCSRRIRDNSEFGDFWFRTPIYIDLGDQFWRCEGTFVYCIGDTVGVVVLGDRERFIDGNSDGFSVCDLTIGYGEDGTVGTTLGG